MEQVNSLFQQGEALAQVRGWFCLEDKLNFLRDLLDAFPSQGERDPFSRTHGVDGDWEL